MGMPERERRGIRGRALGVAALSFVVAVASGMIGAYLGFTAMWNVCVGADCAVQDDVYGLYARLFLSAAPVILAGGLILAYRLRRR